MYMLLGDCQGIVGHLPKDFDTGAYLSGIFFYVIFVLPMIWHLFCSPQTVDEQDQYPIDGEPGLQDIV